MQEFARQTVNCTQVNHWTEVCYKTHMDWHNSVTHVYAPLGPVSDKKRVPWAGAHRADVETSVIASPCVYKL